MSYLTIKPQNERVYFEQQLGVKRTMVFAHGWGMSCRVWDTVAAGIIDRGYGVMTFDQRGCGRSDKSFTRVSVGTIAEDLVTLIDEQELSDVVLNGWSLGGAVVVEAAHRLGARC